MITFASYGSFWFGFALLNQPEAGIAQALGGPTSPLLTDAVGK
jgi:succinate-acetate transporter protein